MTEFSSEDLTQLKGRNISIAIVENQLERFRTGFPYLKIDSPASVGHGIMKLDHVREAECTDRWNRFQR